MKNWILACWNTAKVFLAFSLCTLLFYFGLRWLNQEYENYHRYDEPNGKAVKVFQMDHVNSNHQLQNRFLYFIQTGE